MPALDAVTTRASLSLCRHIGDVGPALSEHIGGEIDHAIDVTALYKEDPSGIGIPVLITPHGTIDAIHSLDDCHA